MDRSNLTKYEVLIDNLMKNEREDWGKIIEICDVVAENQPTNEKIVLFIMNYITETSINVAILAITLLNACFNQCGMEFQIICSSSSVLNRLTQLLSLKSNTPSVVCAEIKKMIQNWVIDYGSMAHIKKILIIYMELKKEGHEFPACLTPIHVYESDNEKPISTNNSQTKEELDLALALSESLKDYNYKSQSSISIENSGGHDVEAAYPSFNDKNHFKNVKIDAKKKDEEFYVRGLYSFKAVEDGELEFSKGDIINLLDSKHPDWWRGELKGRIGLFPSNYVEKIERKKIETFDGQIIESYLIDDLLQKLIQEHKYNQSSDSSCDIEKLYEQVAGELKPLIDKELIIINQREEELIKLHSIQCQSITLYENLSNDSQIAFLQANTNDMEGSSSYGHLEKKSSPY